MSEWTAQGRRGRVLVVDDKAANRELLRQELEDEGFEVLTVGSGAECLDKAITWGPFVIILDIQMPIMDGLETCRRLKAEGSTSHIPVLFLTAHETNDASIAEALRVGGNDFLVKPYNPTILLARVTCQMAIYRAHATLRQIAITDELTSVYSRRYLFEALRQAIRDASRQPSPPTLGVLMIDVDHFKKVNDKLGHLAGDEVLRSIAQALKRAVRGNDVVARFGGEEFVIVLPQTGLASARRVGEKVRGAVETAVREPAAVTISVGAAATKELVVGFVQSEGGVDEVMRKVLRRADEALYRAKGEGRNRVCAAD